MKKLLLIPAILIMLPVILFIAAGTPFVMGLVKQRIEQTVGDNLGIPMKISSLDGNLFFGLHAKDIEMPGLGRVAGLEVTYNAFGLLSRRVDIRAVRIDGIEIDVDRLFDVLGSIPKKADSLPSKSSPLKIQIERFLISEAGVGLKIGEDPLNIVLSARGMLLQDRLILDSLHIETKRSVAVLKGIVPLTKTAELDVVFDIDLGAEDFGIPSLAGDLASSGTIKGEFSSPVIKALNRVNALIMGSEVDGVIDLAWHLPHFDSLVVLGNLRLTTVSLERGTVGHDTWDVKMHMDRMQTSVEFLSRYGVMQADGIVSGEISRPNFEGRISGRFDYQGFKPSFEGHVQYGGGMLKVPDFRLESKRVTMELASRYDQNTRRIGDTKLALYCKDLGVVNSILDGPEDLSGELWVDVEISGTAENPAAVARVRLSEVLAFGEVITAARFHASMKNAVAYLDSGMVQSARGFIDLQGYYDLKKERVAIQLSSERLAFDSPTVFGTDTLLVGGSVSSSMLFAGDIRNPRGRGDIRFYDVVYDTLQLGDYAFEFTFADTALRFSFADEHNTLACSAEAMLYSDLPFSATAQIKHFALGRFISPVSGHVTAELTASGYLTDLEEIKAALQIDTVELVFESNKLHNMGALLVKVEDGIIKLEQFTLALAGQTIQLQGILPIDFKTAAMDISGKSSTIQLSEIAHFLPRNPPLSGTMNFDIRVQGRPQRLDIDGHLAIDKARYTMKDVILDSVSGRLVFRNGLVKCENLSGKINKGRFEAQGYTDFSHGRLDTVFLEMDFSRIDYANKDFGRILLDADLRADGRGDSLRIKGEIVVVEGVYDAPMRLQKIASLITAANRPVPQQPEISKRIHCDIGITVPDSIMIANNVANLSAKADLQLKGYLSRLNAYGTIVSTGEGTIQYLGRKFNIVSAVIQFDDPYKIDPVIDLTATSTISAADGDYTVSLLLNGTVASWQLELSSTPPLPQQDIVSLLLIGQRRPGEVGSTAKDIDLKGKAKDYALDVVRYGIEKSGEQLLGLDKFTVTGELDDLSSVKIGIEKSVAKGFRLLYTTGIESWELHQVGASYDITDHISIFTLYDQENLNTGVDLDFHFRVK